MLSNGYISQQYYSAMITEQFRLLSNHCWVNHCSLSVYLFYIILVCPWVRVDPVPGEAVQILSGVRPPEGVIIDIFWSHTLLHLGHIH